MLASSLDSHPDIQCSGEYDMIEKFPLGREPGRVKGCIIQSYHLDRGIAPPLPPETKLILLNRSFEEIARSQYCNDELGRSSTQFLSPTDSFGIFHKVPDERLRYLKEQHAILTSYIEGREHLSVSYKSLCKGADVRVIRWEVMHLLCDFLEVDRRPLRPLTYKPSGVSGGI